MTEKYKIKVSPSESEKIQKMAFENGYYWKHSGKNVSHTDSPYLFLEEDKRLMYADFPDTYINQSGKTVTFSELVKILSPIGKKDFKCYYVNVNMPEGFGYSDDLYVVAKTWDDEIYFLYQKNNRIVESGVNFSDAINSGSWKEIHTLPWEDNDLPYVFVLKSDDVALFKAFHTKVYEYFGIDEPAIPATRNLKEMIDKAFGIHLDPTGGNIGKVCWIHKGSLSEELLKDNPRFVIKSFADLDNFPKPHVQKNGLPIINGHKGELRVGYVKYGCAEICNSIIFDARDMFNNSYSIGNREVVKIVLDSGVEITKEEIEQIYKCIKG
jgi:hypothetical protein